MTFKCFYLLTIVRYTDYFDKNLKFEIKRSGRIYLISFTKQDYFDGGKKSVQLDKDGGNYQVRLVIQEDKRNDETILGAMKTFVSQISADVFDSAPTEIHVADEKFETVKVVKP